MGQKQNYRLLIINFVLGHIYNFVGIEEQTISAIRCVFNGTDFVIMVVTN